MRPARAVDWRLGPCSGSWLAHTLCHPDILDYYSRRHLMNPLLYVSLRYLIAMTSLVCCFILSIRTIYYLRLPHGLGQLTSLYPLSYTPIYAVFTLSYNPSLHSWHYRSESSTTHSSDDEQMQTDRFQQTNTVPKQAQWCMATYRYSRSHAFCYWVPTTFTVRQDTGSRCRDRRHTLGCGYCPRCRTLHCTRGS